MRQFPQRNWTVRALLIGIFINATMAFGHPAFAAPTPPSAAQRQVIIRAIEAYVRKEAAVQKVRVERIVIDGRYARATVIPLDVQTDDATVYLREEGSTWRVLGLGTDFSPDELSQWGVPKSLH